MPSALVPQWKSICKNLRVKASLAFIFGGILILHSWSLLRYPAPFTDEGWYANRAWAFLSTGQAFGSADAGVLERFSGYWTYFQWLPTWFRAISMRFFSVPELLSVRIVSLLFGVLLLVAIFWAGKWIGRWEYGYLGALLVSLSAAFLYSAHIARDDIIAAALGYVSLALFLQGRRRPGGVWDGISGLCLGLAFEIHPHSAIFIPAVGALYFVLDGKRVLRSRNFLGFVLGGLLGFVFYLERHILRFPSTYFAISKLFFLDTHTPPLFTFDLETIGQGFLETGLLLFNHYLVLVPAILFAACLLVKDQRAKVLCSPGKVFPANKLILLFIGLLLLGLSLLVRNKFRHYAILITPAIDLALAVYLVDGFQLPWRGQLKDYMHRATLGFVAVLVILNWQVIRPNPTIAYQKVGRELQTLVQPGERILGPETYWFSLHNHPFIDWIQLVIYQRYAPGSSLEKSFQALQPDLFIIDDYMSVFIADQPGNTPFLKHFRLSKTELQIFLADHATLIASIEEAGWVPVHVYRIDWQKEDITAAINRNHQTSNER